MANQIVAGEVLSIPRVMDDAVDALRGSIRGRLLRDGDPGFEEARHVWNGMIDRRPQLIVQCTGTADVVATVRFAREQGIPLSVRGGGHNVSGSAVSDGGLMIDLSPMRMVHVDPERRLVEVSGGALLGDVDHETTQFGLAVPMGVMSRTGVAGLALHGGMGLMLRKYGLTSDNLVAAEVVTADGQVLMVDASHHPDLFWAIRGGGGNFGIVTRFTFRVHPVEPAVWVTMTFYPMEKARKVVGFFRDFMREAPDELMALAIYWNAPTEHFPEEHQGKPVVLIAGAWAGPVDEGERETMPLRQIDEVMADLSGPMPFRDAQRLFDPEYPDGRRYYWKSSFLQDLTDETIDLLTAHSARRPSALSSVDVWALGGAFGRMDPRETAFHERRAPFLLGIEANWDDPAADEANVGWARALFDAVQRTAPAGAYYNFPGFLEEGDALLRRSFGENYARLREVKARYDPDDFFRYNTRILGAAETEGERMGDVQPEDHGRTARSSGASVGSAITPTA